MLESLAFALVKTFITFMFQQHLEHMQTVKIEGAPGWYYQQTKEHICDSGFAYGTLEAVDSAKADARKHMVIRLQNAMESVVYENFRERRDPLERALIDSFKTDANLPVFVEGSVIYENIEYREKQSTAYTRVCIPKEKLVSYQEERVGKLKKAVTLHHRDRAMGELDGELAPPPKK
jgi:hypothetical protein